MRRLLVKPLGTEEISRCQVKCLCVEVDAEVTHFRQCALTASHLYIWLDATLVKVRKQGRVNN